MIQESEIVALVFSAAAVLILYFLLRTTWVPGRAWFVAGFFLIVSAYVFTVIEDLWRHDLFNILEHLGYALSGLCFAIGARSVRRMQERIQKERVP